jgi:GNAT superfamily N-acetyltransferase
VDIKQVEPADAQALRAVWEVETAATLADLPELPADPVEELLNEPTDLRSRDRVRWLARDNGRAVGAAKMSLPKLDNTGVAELWIVVHPDHRRRGIGRELLDVALQRARDNSRSCVMGEVPERLSDDDRDDGHRTRSPGALFAAAAGAKEALAEMCRVLDLEAVDEERVQALEAEARSRSQAYELVQWAGPAPDELLADLAWLTSRLSTDAPLGDLAWEEESWDGERYREAEAEAAATGREWVSTAARHLESGRVVAYTDIGVSKFQPEVAYQWTTIVDGAHRGHRLGMLIKVANLRLLRREQPAAQRIFTWNADSNEHMLAINKAMGFRPVAKWYEWQLHLS